jgi:hypothetical protein
MSFAANGQRSSLGMHISWASLQVRRRFMEYFQHLLCSYRQSLPFLLGNAPSLKSRTPYRSAKLVFTKCRDNIKEKCLINSKNFSDSADDAWLYRIVAYKSKIDDQIDQ